MIYDLCRWCKGKLTLVVAEHRAKNNVLESCFIAVDVESSQSCMRV